MNSEGNALSKDATKEKFIKIVESMSRGDFVIESSFHSDKVHKSIVRKIKEFQTEGVNLKFEVNNDVREFIDSFFSSKFIHNEDYQKRCLALGDQVPKQIQDLDRYLGRHDLFQMTQTGQITHSKFDIINNNGTYEFKKIHGRSDGSSAPPFKGYLYKIGRRVFSDGMSNSQTYPLMFDFHEEEYLLENPIFGLAMGLWNLSLNSWPDSTYCARFLFIHAKNDGMANFQIEAAAEYFSKFSSNYIESVPHGNEEKTT